MRSRRIYLMTAALVAGFVALAALPAAAQFEALHRHGDFDHGMLLGHVAERLGLTEDQKTALHEMMAGHHEAMQSRLDASGEAHAALHDQIIAEDFDETAIRDAFAEVAVIQSDLMVAHAELLGKVRQILTDEQAVELHEMLGDMKGSMGKMAMGHGRRGPHGH